MNFLKIVTPLTVAFVVMVMFVIYKTKVADPSTWKSVSDLIYGISAVGAIFFVDFFTRVHFKDDAKKVWIYELIIILAALVVLVSRFKVN